MNHKNHKTIIIALLAALSLTLMLTFGCSKRSERSGLYAAQLERDSAYAMAEEPMTQPASARSRQIFRDGADDASAAGELNTTERKLVKSAYLRIRVENLDAADASITELLQRHDAYAASTVVDENFRTYSLRVPAPRYGIFLAEMNGMGRLLHRSENTEDVTLRYYDLEGRLETKKELLKTFQSYLKTAKTIEEILAVEARISELQYDIEGTGKQLRALANNVDYATIELNLMGPAAAHQNRSETLGERLKRMFGGFVDFLSGVVGAIVGIVIYGIPTLLLVFFFFWLLFGRIGLLRKLWRLVKAKKSEQ